MPTGGTASPHRPDQARATARAAAVLLAVAGLLSPAVAAQRPTGVPPLSGGIQVNEPDHAAWTAAVRDAGLDSVQVTLYARQLAWDSAEMILPADTSAVVAEIRAARRRGLRVVLVLRVALEHGLAENRHLWHGMIWPRDRSAVDAWFDRYREFALAGAELARREGVDLLAVASELNSLTSTRPVDEMPDLYAYFLDPERTAAVRRRLVECAETVPPGALDADLSTRDGTRYPSLDAFLRAEERRTRAWTRRVTGTSEASARGDDLDGLNRRRAHYERRWRDLLGEIRGVYPGPVTYAANFDQVEEVGFWDALDALGVNAYYPLGLWGLEGTDLRQRIARSWRLVAARLQALGDAQRPGRGPLPVIFLELGWTRRAGATVRPYSYHRVEVLETVAPRGVEPPLTCVHWATQPERPRDRLAALTALLEVVRAGHFPALRGFSLWKLTTLPSHREIEPFAIVLPTPEREAATADVELVDVAARLAEEIRAQAPDGVRRRP